MRELEDIILVSDVAGVILTGANSDKAYSNHADRTGIPQALIRAVLRTHRGESKGIEKVLSPNYRSWWHWSCSIAKNRI